MSGKVVGLIWLGVLAVFVDLKGESWAPKDNVYCQVAKCPDDSFRFERDENFRGNWAIDTSWMKVNYVLDGLPYLPKVASWITVDHTISDHSLLYFPEDSEIGFAIDIYPISTKDREYSDHLFAGITYRFLASYQFGIRQSEEMKISARPSLTHDIGGSHPTWQDYQYALLQASRYLSNHPGQQVQRYLASAAFPLLRDYRSTVLSAFSGQTIGVDF